MCTLVIGRDVLAPGTAWIAANRDEDPARPSDAPAVLVDHPRVAGGRDRVAGGTWLAIRADGVLVAMLNRRPARVDDGRAGQDGAPGTTFPPPALRSRGVLALETVANVATGDAAGASAHDFVVRSLANARYAAFALVIVTPEDARVLTHDPAAPLRVARIGRGWHVLTHADLDDGREPRTRSLCADLASWRPADERAVEDGLIARLARHAPPAVCLHEGRMVTVSATLARLARGATRYLHAEGRPCENAFADNTALLGTVQAGREST